MNVSAFPSVTALHEAGHFVIANHLAPDAYAAAVICDGIEDGVPYGGTCFHHPDAHTPHGFRMIGVAGALAVGIAGCQAGRLPRAEQVLAMLSPSDWRVTGEDPANPSPAFADAIEDAFRLLIEQWSTVIAVAQQLDDVGNVLNDAALRLAESLDAPATPVAPGAAAAGRGDPPSG